MLTTNEETRTAPSRVSPQRETIAIARPPEESPGRLARALRIEWLGQMVASICWIVSVFSYGITSTGDWLQLAAACSWAVANVASIMTIEDR